MNFRKGYKILVLSYFNIRNLCNTNIVRKYNKRCEYSLDVIQVALHKYS